MVLNSAEIADTLWGISPASRRRKCVNALIHGLEQLATAVRTAQQPAPPPPRECVHADDGGEHDDEPDERYPTAAELAAIEAMEEPDGVADEPDLFSEAAAVLDGKLSYDGCLTVANVVVRYHGELVAAKISTEALLHLIETMENPETGEEVDFDSLTSDGPRP